MTLDQCKKYNKQIGSKIKTLREEQGISQAELAEKSGISTTYLSLLENGKRNNITLSTLYMLGDALHVEISQLLCFCSHSIDEAIDPPNPDDEAEARQMLARLSGRWHSVFTGVSLVQGERHLTFSCETRVRFFDLTAAEIDAYIATGECMDKAGAYGIQGYGSLLVQEIQGDYFNVVGLPVSRLYRALNDFEQK